MHVGGIDTLIKTFKKVWGRDYILRIISLTFNLQYVEMY